MSIGLAAAGKFAWSSVLPYIASQVAGAFASAVTVYVFYKDHFDATDGANTKLGVFATIPAIENKGRNLLSEIIGTFVLILAILFIGDKSNASEVGLGSIGALPVALLVVAIGLSLGGTTGYAINPARDFGPRLAHQLLNIKGKGSSRWSYSWVPVAGPVIGSPGGCRRISACHRGAVIRVTNPHKDSRTRQNRMRLSLYYLYIIMSRR